MFTGIVPDVILDRENIHFLMIVDGKMGIYVTRDAPSLIKKDHEPEE